MKRPSAIFISLVVAFLCVMTRVPGSAAIVFPKLPDGCPQMTPQALADFVWSHHFVFSMLHSTTNLSASEPFRGYFATSQQLLSGESPGSEPAWALATRGLPTNYLSYMILSGTNMVEMLTVGLDASNHWEFGGSMCAIDQPDPMWVAYKKAGLLPQVKKQDYEFRYLMIDADVRAVWLHCQTDDIVIPFPLGYKTPWKGFQPYSIAELARLSEKELDTLTNGPGVMFNNHK